MPAHQQAAGVGHNAITTQRVIRYSLILPLLVLTLSLTSLVRHTDQSIDIADFLVILVITTVPWAIGLLIGLLLSVIFKSPKKEPLFYVLGQGVVLFTIISIFGYNAVTNLFQNARSGNIASNHEFVDLDKPDNYTSRFIKTAFKLLEKRFKNKNNFVLLEYFSTHRDSLNGTYTDTVRTVYFHYYLTGERRVAFSQIDVFEDKAVFIKFNEIPTNDNEYLKLQKEKATQRKKELDMAKKTLRDLPDYNTPYN